MIKKGVAYATLFFVYILSILMKNFKYFFV